LKSVPALVAQLCISLGTDFKSVPALSRLNPATTATTATTATLGVARKITPHLLVSRK